MQASIQRCTGGSALKSERPSQVTFAEVEEVLGFPLPNSCRHHVPYWLSYDGSAVARAIIDAGWKASHVNLADQTVTLTRVNR